MAKDKKGKFVSEGKEDYVPMNPLESWENSFPITVDSGAAANAAKYKSEPTGLGQRQGAHGALGDQEVAHRRWTLFGGIFRPRKPLSGINDITADHTVAVQVQIGTQTATGILPVDDPRVVGTGVLNILLHTEGCTQLIWPLPLDIFKPRPLYADELTAVVNGAADVAELRNIEWLVQLFYAVAEGDMADRLTYLEALRT